MASNHWLRSESFNAFQLGGHLSWTVDDIFGTLGAGWCRGVDGVA